NDSGDLVFQGDLSPGNPSGTFQDLGVYFHSKGTTIAIARPGDPMPGGGHFVTASFFVAFQVHVNNEREVSFSALLDTDDNHDGSPDTGLYVWSHGVLHVVARTGTVIPGLGTIRHLATFVTGFPPPPVNTPNSGATNNDRGQVFFAATLTDGRGVLLIATPTGR
ncbi:MAG TPA: choice-of-anchor tandem repeat NxxGxxAF-containing protein, partial [Acidobacteriaceae bacterium]|nr:choice-of-anchor tandem repeat NxxGxxAF-containing protein [Acidobacteriaceae bacterium]